MAFSQDLFRHFEIIMSILKENWIDLPKIWWTNFAQLNTKPGPNFDLFFMERFFENYCTLSKVFTWSMEIFKMISGQVLVKTKTFFFRFKEHSHLKPPTRLCYLSEGYLSRKGVFFSLCHKFVVLCIEENAKQALLLSSFVINLLLICKRKRFPYNKLKINSRHFFHGLIVHFSYSLSVTTWTHCMAKKYLVFF